ncbi:MAG: RDD family protein [Candidatus Limnocylindrales bacterium]
MSDAVAVTTPVSAKAGFWRRVGAWVIDTVLLTVIGAIVIGVLSGGDGARGVSLNGLVGLAYYLYFWSHYGHGQTLGMRALSMRVVKTDGGELGLGGALLRYVGLLISMAALFIGVVWVAFDKNKQGWHDKIASTYVITV